MVTIPTHFKELISPLNSQPSQGDMLLSSLDSAPSMKLTPRGRAVITKQCHEREVLLDYLHRSHIHVYCYCTGGQPAASHVKRREGTLFFARNPSSPEHDSHCSLFHAIQIGHRRIGPPPIPVSKVSLPVVETNPDINTTPEQGHDVLNLMRMTARDLQSFYHRFIEESERDVWVPGRNYLSAKPMVEASGRYSLAPGIPLSWFFKGRQSYLPDLIQSLQRRSSLWPDGTTPHGLVYIKPDEFDSDRNTITLDGVAMQCEQLLVNCSEVSEHAGLMVVDVEGRCRCAVLLPVVGKVQDLPVRNSAERRVMAYLMKTLSNWDSNPRYGVKLSLKKAWNYGNPKHCATVLVSGDSSREEIPVLAIHGDIDDFARLRSFERVFAGKGVVIDFSKASTVKDQFEALNQRLFSGLVARKSPRHAIG